MHHFKKSAKVTDLLKPLASSVFVALLVTACGGGGSDDVVVLDKPVDNKPVDNKPVDNKPVNTAQIELNQFEMSDNYYLNKEQHTAIERKQERYSTSAQKENRYFMIDNDDSFKNASVTALTSVEPVYEGPQRTFTAVGDNFQAYESKASSQVEKINGKSTVVLTLIDEGSDKKAVYKIAYQPISLAGHSVADSRRALVDNQGINTVFNKFDKLPGDVVFPENSVCWVKGEEMSDMPLYIFHHSGQMSKNEGVGLDEWENRIVTNYGKYSRAITSAVGPNNTFTARRLTYTDDYKDGTATDYVDGVAFDFSAVYFNKDSSSRNLEEARYVSMTQRSAKVLDPTKALVSCEGINDTAADFLETQLAIYY